MGSFYSGVYPTVVSYSGRMEPDLAPLSFSLMTAMGPIGAIFLTPTVGYAAVYMPFSWAMSLIGVPVAILAVLVVVLKFRNIF